MPTVFGAAAPRYAPILVPQQQFQQQQQSGGEEVLVSLQSPVNGGLRGISSPRGVGMGGGWMSPQGGQVGVYRGGPAAPSAAMVELHSVFSTPGSVPRYSERDVQAIKRDMRLQFEKEFELAQVEVAELERKRAEAVEGTRRIQATLKEWEGFMREMIAKKEQDDARARQDVTALRGLLDKTSQERDAKAKELEELHARHRALRLDLEDEREAREKVSAERDAALGAVQEAGERYEMLKAHAEDKLESANVEIARVRAGLEKEITALRIKVSRAELHVASLVKSMESKTAENAELTKICDDLLLQIENSPGS
ncbi:transforming acidic coiled-coil-containing protein-domain containing protein [Chytriomyces sp. MP71]|nr:transforming acidic coiled-coil-containing protein-domain containing protein [Chytriomyces sp. MP71]